MEETPVPPPIASQAERSIWREIHNLQGDLRELEKAQQAAAVVDASIKEQMLRVYDDVRRIEAAILVREDSVSRELGKRVTLERYKPTELIVFGIVALFGSAIIAAVAAMIFKGTHP